MTRIPNENRDVTGLDYDSEHPKYRVGPLCSIPGCSRIADHAHHIWRRSFLGGDYGWVKLWDETVVQNLTGLCWQHHQDVTENRSMIEYFPLTGFVWKHEKDLNGYLLDPQPKRLADRDTGSDERPNDRHDHFGNEKCPTCKRRIPKEKTETAPEGRKPRANWNVTVPAEARENGADVLDTLLEAARELSPYADDSRVTRYHVLAWALSMFVLHGEQILSDA